VSAIFSGIALCAETAHATAALGHDERGREISDYSQKK